MKKLLNSIKNQINEKTETETKSKQELLDDAVSKIAEIKSNYDALDKTYKENKDTIKTLCTELGLEKYNKNGIKISLSHVDKSYLEEGPVLEYLKKNNLSKSIKTKEYFDEAEIAMAIANNELNAAELSPFIVKKEQINIYIKEDKEQ